MAPGLVEGFRRVAQVMEKQGGEHSGNSKVLGAQQSH